MLPKLIEDAIGIAIVSFVLTLSLAKLFAKKAGYRIDANQEPYAYGEIIWWFTSIQHIPYIRLYKRDYFVPVWLCGVRVTGTQCHTVRPAATQ
jgi:hypothetical protein